MKYDTLQNLIKTSRFLVCLEGIHVSEDCGCMNYRDDANAYDIEEKYSCSPEEIFNATFFNTRPDQFYTFFRNEMLSSLGAPDDCIKVLQKMESDGLLKCIITRELYSLAKRAGCRNVIELHGNVFEYHCPRCGKAYEIQDILAAKSVPLCQDCQTVIRPGVALVGESLSNRKLSEAADLISHADTLLILGCNMKSVLPDMSLQFFQGENILLVNEPPHYADCLATHIYHAKPRDLLPQVYPLSPKLF